MKQEDHGDPSLTKTSRRPSITSTQDDLPPTPVSPPPKRSSLLTTLSDQWFLLAMAVVILIASQVQVPVSHQPLKRTVVSYLCISIIFFITGCTLDTQILLQNYRLWKAHLFVQAQSFLLFSAIVFGIVSLTALNEHFMDPGLLVGLIFESCMCTTMSSNVIMTGQSGGNRELTVVQTTIGNFIGVFVSPALVVMYTSVNTWYNHVLPPISGEFQAVYSRVLMQLGLSLYLPLVAGQLTRWLFPKAVDKAFRVWKLSKVGSLCLLVIIWQTYDQAFATKAFSSVPGSNMVFIVFMSIGLWILIFGIAFLSSVWWMPRRDVVSVLYCVPAKGVASGVPMSTTIFGGIDLTLQSKIQIPIVLYQGLQVAFGSLLIPLFRKWIQQGEKRNGDVENLDDGREKSEKIDA